MLKDLWNVIDAGLLRREQLTVGKVNRESWESRERVRLSAAP